MEVRVREREDMRYMYQDFVTRSDVKIVRLVIRRRRSILFFFAIRFEEFLHL